MATAPKAGGYNWNQDIAKARSLLRKQRRLIADHIDGRIDQDLLLTALTVLNAQTDEALEDVLRVYKP